MIMGSSFLKSLVIAVFCLLFACAPAWAQQKTHTVQKGETLFSIARQYDVTVEDLRQWNDLEGNELKIGQELVVTGADSAPVVHTVKTQETLYSISKKYGVSIAELKNWNNLSNNTLDVGQQLNIYEDRSGQQGGTESIVEEGESRQNAYYTVKSGDTLYEIARQHNMTVDQLKSLNDLQGNMISVGQRLTVHQVSAPPSVTSSSAGVESSPQGKFVLYTVERQMSRKELLDSFRMDQEELQALNPELDSDRFFRGQKVTVLAPATKSYDNPYRSQASLKNLGTIAASRYDSSATGKTTTSGELYTPKELTGAHSNIAIGTVIFVQNATSGRGLYVRINDRLSGEGLKLSEAAWKGLGLAQNQNKVQIYQDQ